MNRRGFERKACITFSDFRTRSLAYITSHISCDAADASVTSASSATAGLDNRAGKSTGRRLWGEIMYCRTSFGVAAFAAAARETFSSQLASVNFACWPKILLWFARCTRISSISWGGTEREPFEAAIIRLEGSAEARIKSIIRDIANQLFRLSAFAGSP